MSDYYLEDSTRLQGQPKRTIADYVEQQGILVPRRFGSLKEARSAGVPIIARTEHRQDYMGVSGLLGSPSFLKIDEQLTESGIKQKVFQDYRDHINGYCKEFNIDKESLMTEVSFSFWEQIGGYNRTIIADSAVLGRYHVTTFSKTPPIRIYSIVESQGNVQHFGDPLPSDADNFFELVKLYEQVRNLDRFDPNHCPILEIQTVDTKNYFLQYHRTRDFSPANFSLDRTAEADETIAIFTRGATPQEGVTAKRGSGDYYYNLQSLPAAFMFTHASFSIKDILEAAVHSHLRISLVYKPCVFVVAPKPQSDSEASEDKSVLFRVVSDGRKAYVKRV